MSNITEESPNVGRLETPQKNEKAIPAAVVEDETVIDGVDPVYAAKARVLNRAIQDIGMGRYQWQIFFVIGFGWAQDNLWPIVTSLILTPITNEFRVSNPPLLTLAQNIGLLAGAVFWGFGCDIFGRKWGFNLTLGVTGVFGMLTSSSPTFAAAGVFAALYTSSSPSIPSFPWKD
ncbi:uncharacterized protein L201_007562 [Kwoniella dendrophila CBS 6074]|uniref:Major facilitator superfamily (MFS) profile domain-containing protein n=1 Tax=Kwoniella dendrophila CBS 6074 TaxID=1295534 RepID=A0AAX4K611_9TREE